MAAEAAEVRMLLLGTVMAASMDQVESVAAEMVAITH
jgi:hypothetical protein